MGTGVPFRDQNGRSVKLTIHRHLVPPPALHMLSWRGQGQVYFFTSSNVYRLVVAFRSSGERGAKLNIHVYQCHGYERMKLYIHCSMCTQMRC
jgi:hypothetical protein